MDTLLQRFYRFCWHSVKVLCLLLSAVLLSGSFLMTSYSTDMESQKVLFRWDNPLWNLLGTGAFLALFLLVSGKGQVSTGRMRAVALLWCCLAGAVLIVFGRSVPAGDGMSVYAAAQELAEGRTGVIDPDNSYFSYYPQQIGLVGFYEILIRLWNLLPFSVPAYHFIKGVNVVLACGIVLFQEKTVHLLWKNEKTDRIHLLLAGLNLPFLMYTSFVYGEIPSFAFVSAGIYFVLRFLGAEGRKSQWGWALGAIGCLAAAVVLRKNNLIFVIAVLIVVFLQFLKERKTVQLLFVPLCAVCAFGALPGVQRVYELRADNYLRSGVPAMAYFAMGMQDEPGCRCGGWYNGFNFDVYQEAGLDADAASKVSREAIRERMAVFREDPGYAALFYGRKHLSQWADGTYASRQATLAVFGGRSGFFKSLYEGELSGGFIAYGNLYQNILYLGLFAFCFRQCRRFGKRGEACVKSAEGAADMERAAGETLTEGLPMWIGLIGVIGGFLFHTAWEANSRYILLYSLAMLPCSAWGCYYLTNTCSLLLKRCGHRG